MERACAQAAGELAVAKQRLAELERKVGQLQVELDRQLELQLLADIRAVFGAADRLTTEALLKTLLADDERPWRRPERGRALGARLLASRLLPFGVRLRVIRLEGKAFARTLELASCVHR